MLLSRQSFDRLPHPQQRALVGMIHQLDVNDYLHIGVDPSRNVVTTIKSCSCCENEQQEKASKLEFWPRKYWLNALLDEVVGDTRIDTSIYRPLCKQCAMSSESKRELSKERYARCA